MSRMLTMPRTLARGCDTSRRRLRSHLCANATSRLASPRLALRCAPASSSGPTARIRTSERAAVDGDLDAGEVAAGVADHGAHDVGDLLGRAHVAERRAGVERVDVLHAHRSLHEPA